MDLAESLVPAASLPVVLANRELDATAVDAYDHDDAGDDDRPGFAQSAFTARGHDRSTVKFTAQPDSCCERGKHPDLPR